MTDATTAQGLADLFASSKAKERSPNYPALTLTAAIAAVQKLYDKEKRTTLSSESVANAVGYGSLSGRARTAIASMRQYGLIENNGEGVRVSDLAMDILHHPAGSIERKAAIQAAALRPPMIAELLGTHGQASDETIKAYLITRKKFAPEGAARLVEAFRDALSLAEVEPGAYRPDKAEQEGADKVRIPIHGNAPPPAKKPGDQMQFTWPLSGDVVATLTVSRHIESDDVDTLTDYFEIAKKALLKAARSTADSSKASTGERGSPDGSQP